jgi:hypothetical protein
MGVPFSLRGARYSLVINRISVWALHETAAKFKEAEDLKAAMLREERAGAITTPTSRRNCTGTFRQRNGRPCEHELLRVVCGERMLQPADFDIHWWIDRSAAAPAAPPLQPRVLEPAVIARPQRQRRQARRTGAGPTGNRRDPLLAELVDRNYGIRHHAPLPLQPLPSSQPLLQQPWQEALTAAIYYPQQQQEQVFHVEQHEALPAHLHYQQQQQQYHQPPAMQMPYFLTAAVLLAARSATCV